MKIDAGVPADHRSTALLGSRRTGTATFVDAAGLVLTVNYLVIGATAIEATLFDGRVCTGKLVAQDFTSGLAALQLQVAGGAPFAPPLRSSATLSPGEEVFLVAAVGEEGPRVATGAVSYVGPFEAYWEYWLSRAIMATVMSPGLGGGPMFDSLGRMVGIVSLNPNEVGRLSLAVPVECFSDHQGELLKHGRRVSVPPRAWIGLYCHTIDDHVVIVGVVPGGPGECGGLKAGDVVVALDDAPVAERRELYHAIASRRPGDRLSFRVLRDDGVMRVDVAATSVEEMFR